MEFQKRRPTAATPTHKIGGMFMPSGPRQKTCTLPERIFRAAAGDD
jgi:hypothetical protein